MPQRVARRVSSRPRRREHLDAVPPARDQRRMAPSAARRANESSTPARKKMPITGTAGRCATRRRHGCPRRRRRPRVRRARRLDAAARSTPGAAINRRAAVAAKAGQADGELALLRRGSTARGRRSPGCDGDPPKVPPAPAAPAARCATGRGWSRRSSERSVELDLARRDDGLAELHARRRLELRKLLAVEVAGGDVERDLELARRAGAPIERLRDRGKSSSCAACANGSNQASRSIDRKRRRAVMERRGSGRTAAASWR